MCCWTLYFPSSWQLSNHTIWVINSKHAAQSHACKHPVYLRKNPSSITFNIPFISYDHIMSGSTHDEGDSTSLYPSFPPHGQLHECSAPTPNFEPQGTSSQLTIDALTQPLDTSSSPLCENGHAVDSGRFYNPFLIDFALPSTFEPPDNLMLYTQAEHTIPVAGSPSEALLSQFEDTDNVHDTTTGILREPQNQKNGSRF